MREWFEEAVAATWPPSPEVEGYLMSRGVKEETMNRLRLGTWRLPDSPAPDEFFRKRFGPLGQAWEGNLITPLWSPRGKLLGVESRSIEQKRISRYLLPEAKWNPVFLGMCPEVMQRIWEGAVVDLSEGLFDLVALEWAVPDNHVELATVRAQVSDRHARFLGRFARNGVNVIYDNDDAGRAGTVGSFNEKTGKKKWGALQVLAHAGVPHCRAIPYKGDDPGEIWKDHGADGLRRAFASAF